MKCLLTTRDVLRSQQNEAGWEKISFEKVVERQVNTFSPLNLSHIAVPSSAPSHSARKFPVNVSWINEFIH